MSIFDKFTWSGLLGLLTNIVWTATTKRMLRALVNALFRWLYKKITGETYKPPDNPKPPIPFK